MFLNNLKIILVTIVTFLVHACFVVYTMHTLVLYFNFFKDASPNSWMLVFIGGVYLLYLH